LRKCGVEDRLYLALEDMWLQLGVQQGVVVAEAGPGALNRPRVGEGGVASPRTGSARTSSSPAWTDTMTHC
jgi:hypothetical protein